MIPARYASTRFPGKPLVRQTGKFLVQHVVEQARKSRLAEMVIVATDDLRIFDAVRGFGGQVVMTSDTHPSGTDRIAEVARRPEFMGVQAIVNVQGDEPDIDPALIDSLLEALDRPEVAIATASAPFTSAEEVTNPNFVKVVTDRQGLALYFSRSVMPYNRDQHGTVIASDLRAYRRHLGIYAYKRAALLALAGAPVCELERLEKLEQLRALYLGMRIYVHPASAAPLGVDTPDDYVAFVRRHKMAMSERTPATNQHA